jgi:hypothetical protein
MPRLIRVGDPDDDITHPGDAGPNRMVENDCNVFANGGGSASLALASALGSSAPLDIPRAEAEALLSEVQNDAALIRNGGTRATAGGNPNVPYGPGISLQSNEYAEQFSGEAVGGAPASGTSDGQPGDPNATATPGATPTGQGQAGPNFNNYPQVPDDDFLQFGVYAPEGRQVDPAVVNIARSMSRAVGRRLTVNSGYRSGAYNSSLRGAAQNSNHLYGLAMDISFRGLSDAEKQRMLITAIENGAGGIGIYPENNNQFIHIDIESKRTWRGVPAWGQNIMRTAGYIS